jgi:hypothetical protein
LAIAHYNPRVDIQLTQGNAATGRRMRVRAQVKRFSLVVSLVILAIALIALLKPSSFPHCAVPSGVSAILSVAAAPPALVGALTERIGELVDPGARFDATDVVVTGHNRRLIFIWNAGTRWIVATEHGGIGYNDPILLYELGPERRDAIFLVEVTAFPETVCSAASGLLGYGHDAS